MSNWFTRLFKPKPPTVEEKQAFNEALQGEPSEWYAAPPQSKTMLLPPSTLSIDAQIRRAMTQNNIPVGEWLDFQCTVCRKANGDILVYSPLLTTQQ